MIKRIYHKIRKIIFFLIPVIYLLNLERTNRSNLNFIKRIKLLLKGFSSEKYDLYNFNTNDNKKYLSDYQRMKTNEINGKHKIILNDKNLFEKIVTHINITAKNIGKIQNGKVYINNELTTINIFLNNLKSEKEIIIKPLQGGGGNSITKVSYNNDAYYLDDVKVTYEEFEKYINQLKNHLIQEHLNQADYSRDIYSGTINTIRILTMRDPETKKAFIATAVHKFGSERTKPVDNVWNGGMTALVDINTGILQKSAYHHENNKKITWQNYHPDTKKEIEGTKIPNWDLVKQKIIELTNELDFLNYVGWDVVVTPESVKVIEGNNCSEVNILQIHQPLLTNDKVINFYKHHNIIK